MSEPDTLRAVAKQVKGVHGRDGLAAEVCEAADEIERLKGAARDMVTAWESLPGNTHHSVSRAQRWIVEDMKPAVDKLRAALNLEVPKC